MNMTRWFNYYRMNPDLSSPWFAVGPVWNGGSAEGPPWKLAGFLVTAGKHNFGIARPLL